MEPPPSRRATDRWSPRRPLYASPRVEFGWFETSVGAVFGALYGADTGTTTTRAVMACFPFGGERMVTHGLYRRLGELCAKKGLPMLWIDYPGTSDADGYPWESPQLERYLTALNEACDFLKQRTGATVLTSYGVVLGGLLAYLLAGQRDDIDSCVSHAAPLNARQWLRRQVALASLSHPNRDSLRRAGHREGDEDLGGMLFHVDSKQDLARIDVTTVPPAAVPHVMVIPRDRTSGNASWISRMREAGTNVHFEPEPPVDVDSQILHQGVPPPNVLLENIATWIADLPTEGAHRRRSWRAGKSGERPAAHRIALAPTFEVHAPDGLRVREHFVRFHRGGELCAIVSEPLDTNGVNRLPVAILINGGHNHRPGINRNYTEWARTWAARGLRVFRIDYRGLGDAAPAPPIKLRHPLDQSLNGLYLPRTTTEIRAAIDLAEAQWGHQSAITLGLCAGGFEAIQCALADRRVQGVAAVNLLRMTREPDLGQLLRAVRNKYHWRHYLAAPQHLVRDARDIVRQGSREVLVRTKLQGAKGDHLAGQMLSLTERGTHVLMVYDDEEPMRDLVEARLAHEREALERDGRFEMKLIPSADHIMSPLHAQQKLATILTDWVGRVAVGAKISGQH